MSKAFKCDICGEFYEDSTVFHKYHIINSISETNLDLCDSCRDKITNIIENKSNTISPTYLSLFKPNIYIGYDDGGINDEQVLSVMVKYGDDTLNLINTIRGNRAKTLYEELTKTGEFYYKNGINTEDTQK